MDYDTTLFPYYANCDFEPFIPTAEQIDAYLDSKDPLLNRPDFGIRERSWRMGPYLITVEPYERIFQEAENLLYLERNSTVRTPKLYAAFKKERVDPMYSRANTGDTYDPFEDESSHRVMNYYMVMEYLDGFKCGYLTLDEISAAEERSGSQLRERLGTKIGELLGEQLRKLRSVPPENPNHYGRINGRRYMEAPPLFYTDLSRGPFKYEQLVKRLFDHAHNSNEHSEPGFFTILEDKLLEIASSQEAAPVLTTMSCTPADFAVRLTRDKNNEPIDVEEVVLIKWNHLAWMPPWYEPGGMYHKTQDLSDLVASSAMERMGKANMFTAAWFAEFRRKSNEACGLSTLRYW
ncbi:hypothetical protein BU24DRAFT_406752 [Aaosphaeria arxii CBS 175.79]|uniref:Uncharacterized protein n=1 Tax=Aaosphaeria arxii CBS 175.79 TaxID=1450172 RepID=A0A6A5Y5W2_9PLEO|nr:uncharacterized protein BU24DRAFT_406752 [Aaosphaeria arxii CBS 175.79]KAF2020160.1 hypothetical protein BU24DRAFT_406752 [Aaosphaeria arxii CBS 175.79]